MPQFAAACDAGQVWPAIVKVLERDEPLFAAALSDTVPGPVPPELPAVSHDGAAVDAVQVQVGPVVTLIDVLPASAPNDTLVGDTVYPHVAAPLTPTLSNVAAAVASALWLVSARPTSTFDAMEIVYVPTWVHVTPSADR